MTNLDAEAKPQAEGAVLREVAELLGAPRTLRKAPKSRLETHEMLLQGLPASTLTYLVDNFVFLSWDQNLEKAVGMSLRTFQRHAATASKALSPEQSGRTWKLAEILARATAIFGSKEDAEKWLEQPAAGLDRHRPIDLLATPAGVELVENFLVRLEYGVYT